MMPHQAHRQKRTENCIKGQTKTGPPLRHTGVVDQEVMDEVKHAVPDKGNDDEPEISFVSQDSKYSSSS